VAIPRHISREKKATANKKRKGGVILRGVEGKRERLEKPKKLPCKGKKETSLFSNSAWKSFLRRLAEKGGRLSGALNHRGGGKDLVIVLLPKREKGMIFVIMKGGDPKHKGGRKQRYRSSRKTEKSFPCAKKRAGPIS